MARLFLMIESFILFNLLSYPLLFSFQMYPKLISHKRLLGIQSSQQSTTAITIPRRTLKDTKSISKILLNLLIKNNENKINTESSDIETHITELESNYVPIQTLSFLTFALCGRWKLQYSNFFTPIKSTTNM